MWLLRALAESQRIVMYLYAKATSVFLAHKKHSVGRHEISTPNLVHVGLHGVFDLL
jgi:hypothetical protein